MIPFNNQVLIPELREAGKRIEVKLYPGEPHCFAFNGRSAEPSNVVRALDDAEMFFRRHLKVAPTPVDPSLFKRVTRAGPQNSLQVEPLELPERKSRMLDSLMAERTDQSNTIPLKPVDPSAADAIPRREALAILGSVGAGFALTSVVEAQHPVHQHLASPATIEQAQQKAAVAAYTPEFLDAHQLKTLEALAEAIVPGSTAARVAPFLDQLLAVESPQNQRAFLGSLGAFDMAAIAKHGKAWLALSAAEQDALLRDALDGRRAVGDARPLPEPQGLDRRRLLLVGARHARAGLDRQHVHRELPGCTHPAGIRS